MSEPDMRKIERDVLTLWEHAFEPDPTDGEKFYPYADSKCYWKLFTVDELTQLLQDAEFDILFCGQSKELGDAVEVDVLVCVCCPS